MPVRLTEITDTPFSSGRVGLGTTPTRRPRLTEIEDTPRRDYSSLFPETVEETISVKEDQGRHPWQAGWEGAKTQLGVGLPYAIEKAVGEVTPEEAAEYGRKLRESAAKREKLLPGGALGLGDVRSIGDVGQLIYENVATSAPQIGATTVATVGGGLAGTALAPGPGTFAGAAAGFGSGVAASTPFYVGQNVERATNEGQEDLLQSEAWKSIGVAPLQATADVAVEKFVPGVGKYIPGPKFAPKGGLITRTLKSTGAAAATEGITEPLQTAGERFAAELPLTDPEAIREYAEAGGTGAIVGGALGAATGPVQPRAETQTETRRGRSRRGFDPGRQTGEVIDSGYDTQFGAGKFGDPNFKASQRTMGEVYDYGQNVLRPQTREAGFGKAGGKTVGTSAIGKYQMVSGTMADLAQEVYGDGWRDMTFSPEVQETLAKRLFEKSKNGNLHAIWEGLPDSTPGAYANLTWEQAREVISKHEGTTGGGTFAAAGGGTPAVEAAPELDLYADMDFADEAAVLRFLRREAIGSAKTGPNVTAIAQGIATGDAEAQAAIAKEQAAIDRRRAVLDADEARVRGSRAEASSRTRTARNALADRENFLSTATQLADAASLRRGGAGTSERQEAVPVQPVPPRLAVPGMPDIPATPAADTLLAEQLGYEEFEAQREAQRQAAMAPARKAILQEAVSKNTMDPRGMMTARLRRLADKGLIRPEDAVFTPEEETALQAQEMLRASREETLQQAAAVQEALPEQDVTLGVPERRAPEPIAPEPETAPTRTPEQNIRDRIEDEVGRIAGAAPMGTGASIATWFRRGAESALNPEATIEAPTTKDRSTWFKRGQDFVAGEQAAQARERGEAPAAPAAAAAAFEEAPITLKGKEAGAARKEARRGAKAAQAERVQKARAARKAAKKAATARTQQAIEAGKRRREEIAAAKPGKKAVQAPPKKAAPVAKAAPSKALEASARDIEAELRGKERQAFLDKVDDAVGKQGGITAVQAQQLNIAADAQENLGTESVDRFSLAELEEMFETAKSERATALGRGGKLSIRPSAGMNPQQRAQMAALDVRLRAELNRRGLNDVKLITTDMAALQERLGVEGAEGFFDETDGRYGAISLAMDGGRDPLMGLNHEIVHALRNAGAIRPGDWAKLVKLAMSDEARVKEIRDAYERLLERLGEGQDAKAQAAIRANYGPKLEETIKEEAVAELFAEWAQNPPSPQAVPEAKTIMDRIKAFFAAIRRAITNSTFNTAEEVLQAMDSGQLGRSATGRLPDTAFHGGKLSVFGNKLPPRMQTPQAQIKRASVNRASAGIFKSADDLVRKGHLWLTSTKDMALLAKSLPAMKDVIDLHSRAHALGRDFQERLLEIKDEFLKLPAKFRGNGKGTVNEFLYDSTFAGKWGFKPDAAAYTKEFAEAAVVDPDLQKRFDALPANVQDVIKAVFKFNYDARNNLFAALNGAIEAEFDPQIAEAKTDADKKFLTEEKNRALAEASRVFDTRNGLPYTPLKREGAWAIVAKSKDYIEAEKAGDKTLMELMVSDPEHHYVDFRDTLWEANKAAEDVAGRFPGGAVSAFERTSEDAEQAVPVGTMSMTFKRMQNAIAGDDKLSATAKKEMTRLARDLYLHTLSETSALKGELARENVPGKTPSGEVPDMMRGFVSRGNATANYVASIKNNAEMQAALRNLREQVSAVTGPERTKAQRYYNEFMYRYMATLGKKPNRTMDKIVYATSIYTLLSSPFYYAQNATQNVMITQPLLASRFGYGKTTVAFADAYKVAFQALSNIGLNDRLHFKDVPDALKPLIDYLAKSGHLDAGFSMEMSQWEMNGDGAVPAVWNTVDRFLRRFPQRVEVMNRMTAGIAAYKLAKQKGQTDAQAMQTAAQIIDEAHGDYSGFNSPTPFHKFQGIGRLALQFRKFQLIQGALLVKEFNRMFTGKTRAEKMAGAQALVFLSGHMAFVGGVVGLPASALLGPVIGGIFSIFDDDDEKDWNNWRFDLKEAMNDALGPEGKWLADLLYKGVPYALGVDVSERLGMGNVLALAPYTGMEDVKDQKSLYEFIGKVMLGATGGVVGRAVGAFDWGINNDDWTRVAESITPALLSGPARAYRLKTEGVTARGGETYVAPENIGFPEAIAVAIGVTPSKLTAQTERQSAGYDIEQHYKSATTKMKARWVHAVEEGDRAEMATLRREWEALQAARRRDGYAPQPLSTLLKATKEKARRQRQVIGGVRSTKASRAFAQGMAEVDAAEGLEDVN